MLYNIVSVSGGNLDLDPQLQSDCYAAEDWRAVSALKIQHRKPFIFILLTTRKCGPENVDRNLCSCRTQLDSAYSDSL